VENIPTNSVRWAFPDVQNKWLVFLPLLQKWLAFLPLLQKWLAFLPLLHKWLVTTVAAYFQPGATDAVATVRTGTAL
jgi:hypothetical protein